jgi:hypothetical protein
LDRVEGALIAWVSRVALLAAGLFGARARTRDFVRAYIRRLVRERLRSGLFITLSQLALLAAAALCVHRLGDPLAGRLLGSALVWTLIAFNIARFVRETLPEIALARRVLAGPVGYVVRGILGISIARELVEMELFVLAICLILGVSARFGVSSTFQLLAPWRELVGRLLLF